MARLRTVYWPFALVVLMVLTAGGFVVADRWRRGAILVGITRWGCSPCAIARWTS